MAMYYGESSQVEVPTTELVRQQEIEEALLVALSSTEMDSEQTTKVLALFIKWCESLFREVRGTGSEGTVEFDLEIYEAAKRLQRELDLRIKRRLRRELDLLLYLVFGWQVAPEPAECTTMTICCDADGTITSLHPGLVTPRGGNGAVPVEVGGTYIFRATAPVRSASSGLTVLGGGGGDALGVELDDDINGVGGPDDGNLRTEAHLRSTNWGDPTAPFNEITSAEASSSFATVGGGGGDALGVGERYILRGTAPVPSTSGASNEAMSAESSSSLTVLRGGEGDAAGVELNGGRLPSTARARGHGGSQAASLDAGGGRFHVIDINSARQQGDQGLVEASHRAEQGDQGLVAAARGTQDGPDDLAQRALQSVFGGVVPACLSTLSDDNIFKAGGSPRYIKTAAYAGLGLVTVFTFLGLVSKKRAKAAIRVVASMSVAAVSIAVVYQVSENAYIKCICGIIGCVATMATMAINR